MLELEALPLICYCTRYPYGKSRHQAAGDAVNGIDVEMKNIKSPDSAVGKNKRSYDIFQEIYYTQTIIMSLVSLLPPMLLLAGTLQFFVWLFRISRYSLSYAT